MDTRIRITTIVDYKNFYGTAKVPPEAAELIRGIPSYALLNYISFFNVQLYLNDHPEEYTVQKGLIQTLTLQAGTETQNRLITVFAEYQDKGQMPVIIWNYSNLLFYDLIFGNFNDAKTRDLTAHEIKNLFDAYLIINGITDQRFDIPIEEINKYVADGNMEFFTVSRFTYQRDYFSSTEIQNQIVRGCHLFEFLENRADLEPATRRYYATLGVSGYLQMFATLQVLFVEILQKGEQNTHKNLVNLSEYQGLINMEFLDHLCINGSVQGYGTDLNFSMIRSKFLFKVDQFKYLVLDINFLVNWYYKMHVFALSRFLEEQGVTKEFLSVKGKAFMEDIYFRKIMKRCFPDRIIHLGDTAVIGKDKELCDCYLRQDNNIALFELKDVTLNAEVKESSDVNKMLKAIERKFLVNEHDTAKGIGQLINAITFLNNDVVPFDSPPPAESIEIFPIIVYTDNAFSTDGLNKILNNIFQEKLKGLYNIKMCVHPLTIINLHFFEIFEECFSGKHIDLFDLVTKYHQHVAIPDYHMASFDVFAKMYINENVPVEPKTTAIYNEHSQKILKNLFPLL